MTREALIQTINDGSLSCHIIPANWPGLKYEEFDPAQDILIVDSDEPMPIHASLHTSGNALHVIWDSGNIVLENVVKVPAHDWLKVGRDCISSLSANSCIPEASPGIGSEIRRQEQTKGPTEAYQTNILEVFENLVDTDLTATDAAIEADKVKQALSALSLSISNQTPSSILTLLEDQ